MNWKKTDNPKNVNIWTKEIEIEATKDCIAIQKMMDYKLLFGRIDDTEKVKLIQRYIKEITFDEILNSISANIPNRTIMIRKKNNEIEYWTNE